MPDVELTDDDARFRSDVAAWLADHVVGEYAELKGRGGPGDEDVGFDVRVAWEHELGKAGFIGLGWPVEFGGRGRDPRPAGDLGRGVHTRARRRHASTTWGRTCSPRR